MSILSEAIAKYGGEDAAYTDKLKQHFNSMLGYSNYQSKVDSAANAPLEMSSKGMRPEDALALRKGEMNIRQGNVDSALRIERAVDATSETLASAQASREKAAASARQSAIGTENGVAFIPEDPLDDEILKYMQNPINPDGSIKSLQQFEAELGQKQNLKRETQNPDGSMSTVDIRINPETVNKRIAQRLPKDFIGNENKYFLMSRGFSEKMASTADGAVQYATMTPERKVLFDLTNPTLARYLQEENTKNDVTGALSNVLKTKQVIVRDKEKNNGIGEAIEIPALSYGEYKKQYPNIPAEIEESMIKPFYLNEFNKSLDQMLNDLQDPKKGTTNLQFLQSQTEKAAEGSGANKSKIDVIKGTLAYKRMFEDIKMMSDGALKDNEIEAMILKKVVGF
jgi:hypothetical protein